MSKNLEEQQQKLMNTYYIKLAEGEVSVTKEVSEIPDFGPAIFPLVTADFDKNKNISWEAGNEKIKDTSFKSFRNRLTIHRRKKK